MAGSVQVAVLDVNETLSDMAVLDGVFEDLGLDARLRRLWFASTLRDGFALAAADTSRPFAEVAGSVLRTQLADEPGLRAGVDEAVQTVLAAFGRLGLHPDVSEGLQLLDDAGIQVVTFTNGAAQNAATLCERSGVAHLVGSYLSVDDAGRWKPHPQAYAYCAHACAADPSAMCLIAVHPWDVDGAQRAGMHGAWVARGGPTYPEIFSAPDATGGDFASTVRAVLAL